LHDLLKRDDVQADWVFELNEKTVTISTQRRGQGYEGIMNQGKAVFGRVLNAEESAVILGYIGAVPEDLYRVVANGGFHRLALSDRSSSGQWVQGEDRGSGLGESCMHLARCSSGYWISGRVVSGRVIMTGRWKTLQPAVLRGRPALSWWRMGWRRRIR